MVVVVVVVEINDLQVRRRSFTFSSVTFSVLFVGGGNWQQGGGHQKGRRGGK